MKLGTKSVYMMTSQEMMLAKKKIQDGGHNPRWPPTFFKNIEIKCKSMQNSILCKEHKSCIDMSPMSVPIFSNILLVFTELWPLQNGHEIELSPLPWKCQQLSPLICII